MEKRPLTILLMNRPLNECENVVKDIFLVYKEKYDLIMFPPKESDPECTIQIVFDKFSLLYELQDLLQISIEYDGNDPADFFDFDTTEISEEAFYEVLSQSFDITTFELTEVEKII
jgi:hypothetical protein